MLDDRSFMRRALALARRGIGSTHPNPRVGAVVVRDGKIVGEGWHERPGMPHAEVLALEQAGILAKDATLYVTLEPCHGYGRTPPCTKKILDSGIRRVVFASRERNPKMAGGADHLRAHGIEVHGGVCEAIADELNKAFFHYIATGLPFVTAKAAISLDGKIATWARRPERISGERSRKHAMRLRASVDAIMVGAGTFISDNPRLSVRGVSRKGPQPLRVVMAHHPPRPFKGAFLTDQSAPSRMYVMNDEGGEIWRKAGVEVRKVEGVEEALLDLAREGRLHVLVEGGGALFASLFEARLIQEINIYQAPLLIGGGRAPTLWDGKGTDSIEFAPRLVSLRRKRLGEDLLIQGRVRYPD